MCAAGDPDSSRIVAYSIFARMKARLANDVSEMAVARKRNGGAGCTNHSDRRTQFQSKTFTRLLIRRAHQIDGYGRYGWG